MSTGEGFGLTSPTAPTWPSILRLPNPPGHLTTGLRHHLLDNGTLYPEAPSHAARLLVPGPPAHYSTGPPPPVPLPPHSRWRTASPRRVTRRGLPTEDTARVPPCLPRPLPGPARAPLSPFLDASAQPPSLLLRSTVPWPDRPTRASSSFPIRRRSPYPSPLRHDRLDHLHPPPLSNGPTDPTQRPLLHPERWPLWLPFAGSSVAPSVPLPPFSSGAT